MKMPFCSRCGVSSAISDARLVQKVALVGVLHAVVSADRCRCRRQAMTESNRPLATSGLDHPVIVILLAIVGTISAIAVIRRGATSYGGARMVAMGAATVLVVAAVVTTIAYPDVSARPGDISLVTEDFEFSEQSLTASGGRIAVFVDNKDATLHTFTVEKLAVDLEIPAGEPGRITFAAEPGTYEFFCRPHESDMRGTLRISG